MQKSNIHKKKQPTRADCCEICSYKYVTIIKTLNFQ